jgi:hypothetical protein
MTLTPDERIAEAKRIIFVMGLGERTEAMNRDERDFVHRLYNDLDMDSTVSNFHAAVSVKQLCWLHDLKDRYPL